MGQDIEVGCILNVVVVVEDVGVVIGCFYVVQCQLKDVISMGVVVVVGVLGFVYVLDYGVWMVIGQCVCYMFQLVVWCIGDLFNFFRCLFGDFFFDLVYVLYMGVDEFFVFLVIVENVLEDILDQGDVSVWVELNIFVCMSCCMCKVWIVYDQWGIVLFFGV